MAKNVKKVGIQFDASMDIRDVRIALNQIEQGMKGAKIPAGTTKGLISDIEKLKIEMKNFEAMSSTMKTVGDVEKSERTLLKISELFKRLQVEIKEMEGLDIHKLIPSSVSNDLDKIQKATKDYKKAMADVGKDIEKEKKNITTLIELRREAFATRRMRADARREYDRLEVAQAEMSPKVLSAEAKQKEAEAGFKAGEVSADEVSRLAKVTLAAKTELKNLQKDATAQNNTIRAYTNALEINERKQKSLIETSKQYGSTIKDLEASLNSVGQEAKKDVFEKFTKSLEGIDGLDLSNLEEDLSNIDEITEGLSSEALGKINLSLEEMALNTDLAVDGTEKIDNALRDTKEGAKQLEQTSREVDNLKRQILAFFSVGNALQLFKRSIRNAFDAIKELDEVMTQTAVVTEFTVGDMWKALPDYTKRANELGITVKGAYEAATLFYQQGLTTNEVIAVSTETLKMAKIAGLDYVKATDYMTAALRGFNMAIDENSAQRINDVYSKLAAITAADTEEISVAMTKAASIAHSANMEFETTSAFLAQIIETTREAPETAGTALKTVIARFQELKKDPASIGEVEGEIVDANQIESALRTIGVRLTETSGQFRNLDDVFLEMAEKWDNMDKNTQRYVATIAAGSRQQSRFLAMMADYSRTAELVDATYASAGAGQKQFEKTLESLETALNRLQNAWNEFTMGVANSTVIKGAVSGLTLMLEILNKLTDGFGNVGGAVAKLALSFGLFTSGKAILRSNFVANLFGANIAKDSMKIGRQAGMSFSNGIKNVFKQKGNPLLSNESFAKIEKPEFLMESLKKQVDFNIGDETKATEINKLIENKNIEQARKVYKKQTGKDLEITGQMNEELKSMETNWRAVGAATIAAGVALAGVGTWLEDLGYEKAGKAIKSVGTAAMGLGTIMSVVLPLNAKLGAKLITKAFLSIPLWGILAAATALVVGIGSLVFDAFMKSKNAARILNQETLASEEALKKATEASDALYESFKKYTEIEKTLDGLTKGTDEWRRALIQINDQVLELLSKYPELANYISHGEGGELRIPREGWDTVLDLQMSRAENAQVAVISSTMAEARFAQGMEQSSAFTLEQYAGSDTEIKEAISDAKSGTLDTTGPLTDIEKRALKYLSQLEKGNLELESQARMLLTTSASSRVLGYEHGEQLIGSFAKVVAGDEYAEEQKKRSKELEKDLSLDELKEKYEGLIGEVPEAFEQDEEALANAISRVEQTVETQKKIDGAFSKMSGLDSKKQKEYAALMSGDANIITHGELGEMSDQDVQDYAQFLADFLEISLDEAQGLANKAKDQLEESWQKAVAELDRVYDGDDFTEFSKNLTIGALESLSEVTKGLSKEKGKEFLNLWSDVMESPNLTDKQKEELSTYIATTDWASLNATGDTVEYLQKLGIDPELIEKFFSLATKSAKTYYKSLADVRDQTGKYQREIGELKEAEERFLEGTATEKDYAILEAIGSKYIEAVEVTAEGYRLSADLLNEAILADGNRRLQSSKLFLKQTKEELAEAERILRYGSTVRLITKIDDEGIFQIGEITEANFEAVAKDLNVSLEGLPKEEAIEEVRTAYGEMVEQVNDSNKIIRDSIKLHQMLRFDVQEKAIRRVAEAWSDWVIVLKEGKDADNYDETLESVQEGFKGVLGVTRDLSEEFLTSAENLELLYLILQGDEQAFAALQKKAAVDLVDHSVLSNDIKKQVNKIIKDTDFDDIEIGADLNLTEFMQQLNEMGDGTYEQAEEIARIISEAFNFDIKLKPIMVREEIDALGGGMPRYQYRVESWKLEATSPYDGSGLGGADDDKGSGVDPYLNTLDESYNTLQKITEEERLQAKIAEEYNRLLKDRIATGAELYKQTQDELRSLENQLALQEKLLEERKQQLTVALGKDGDLSKYVQYDKAQDIVQVNYKLIDSVKDPDLGKRIEDRISSLETLLTERKKAETQIEKIKDAVIDIKRRGEEAYLNLYSRVFDALIQQQESMIEELQKTNEAIDSASAALIDAVQKNIEKLRRDRANEKAEEDLAEKERRLAYLRQDTSGTNMMEIRRLEKEIEEGREQHVDSLVDQAITDYQESADAASEQRERQIELAEAQLEADKESGRFAREATDILQEGLGANGVLSKDSRMYLLLEDMENWSSQSVKQLELLIEKLTGETKEAFGYQQTELAKGSTQGRNYTQEIYDAMKVGDTATAAQLESERNRKIDEQGGKYGKASIMEAYNRGYNKVPDKSANYAADMMSAWKSGNWAKAFESEGLRDKKISQHGGGNMSYGSKTMEEWIKAGSPQFKKGGLADFTGPAWLDGSKADPELVLNAKDTKNFLFLKDALSSLLGSSTPQSSSGDNYFDIRIEVENLSSDYDVDQVANRVKQILYSDGTYRNVNTVNLLR